jgi:hypothetical protein
MNRSDGKCEECHKPLGDDAIEISFGDRWYMQAIVCSPNCEEDYVRHWQEYQSDRRRDDIA